MSDGALVGFDDVILMPEPAVAAVHEYQDPVFDELLLYVPGT